MDTKNEPKKPLVQVWEEWDEQKTEASPDAPKLCLIDDPDCEACQ